MAGHLTPKERRTLHQLLQDGLNKVQIATRLGRHRSTIFRELKRNRGGHGYRPKQAQHLAEERRLNCRRREKLRTPALARQVRSGLERLWSPEQIAARCRPRVSRHTIYRWIRRHAPHFTKCLRRYGRPPERRGKLQGIVRIEGRPDIINRRHRFGDWEGDTIVGLGRRNGVLTLTERKSGYTLIAKLPNLESSTTMRAAKHKLAALPRALRHSVTFDNGKEFAKHRTLTKALGLEVYFAAPYKSWQRGTNENTNGLIRQFFPKRTDFDHVTHQQVAKAQTLLNQRPRRRLKFRSPEEIFQKLQRRI